MDTNTISLFGSKKSDDWETPDWLLEQLGKEFHFDLDPCPLNSYYDGLEIPWEGNVFVNPPYSKIEDFLKKARYELEKGNSNSIVFLVFANTDTKWFHNYVLGKAEIRFIKGRLKFKGSSTAGAMRPSILCIFRKEEKECWRISSYRKKNNNV